MRGCGRILAAFTVVAILAGPQDLTAAPRKARIVALGAVRKVAYTKAGDPGGAAAGEDSLNDRNFASLLSRDVCTSR